jgi:Sulfotransferase family
MGAEVRTLGKAESVTRGIYYAGPDLPASARPPASADSGDHQRWRQNSRYQGGCDIIGTFPRVVYLAGFGRSGSTLLERLLGEFPGVCPAGEVVHMWQRGVSEDERCGCGEPFHSCSFWQKVGTTAFGGWDNVRVDRVARLRAAVDRTRCMPLLGAAPLRHAFLPALDEYMAYYLRIYAAIAEVSNSEVVIDSSKHASLAYCLQSCPGLDLRVVQVVRDSRAVAYSWSRIVQRPETTTQTRIANYSATTAAVRWNVQNGALQVLSRLGTPTLRLRYEDLVRDPAARLREITAFAGLPGGAGPEFLHTDGSGNWWADLGVAHTASGNPMRFTTGRIPIRPDDAWRTAMLPRKRRVVTTLTLPLLGRYGYLGRRS